MSQPHRKLNDQAETKSQESFGYTAAPQFCHKPGVLVVDDEHLVRIMVQLGLERNGFKVWLAPNGQEAIELYREYRENIAVVLVDVRMPGLDGPRTLRALRELNPEVLVCFMSDEKSEYEPGALVEGGAAYVITKPFLLDDLANILRLLAHGVPVNLLPSGRINGTV
jgi:DNA-binding response OmpR family regulator